VYGISSLLDEFYSLFSGKSEDNALEVLGLSLNATSSEISHTYRKLSRIHHPDKQVHKSEDEKLNAENNFILIQNAYRLLLERGRVNRKLER
jgi:DnaJ-class molecular chaperone